MRRALRFFGGATDTSENTRRTEQRPTMDDFVVMDLFPLITTAVNATPETVFLAVERAQRDRPHAQDIAPAQLTDVESGPYDGEGRTVATQSLDLPMELGTITLDEGQPLAAHHAVGG